MVTIGEAGVKVKSDTSAFASDLKRSVASSLAQVDGVRRRFGAVGDSAEKATARVHAFGVALALIGAVPAAGTILGLLINSLPALTALPAAAGIAGAAFATMKVGLSGIDQYFKDLTKGGPGGAKAVAKDLAGFAPAARPSIVELANLKDAFQRLVQPAVQGALLKGLSGPLKELGANYLPILKTGMTEVAAAIDGLVKSAIKVANTPFFKGFVIDLFDQTAQVITHLTPFVTGLMKAFAGLSNAGFPLVDMFTSWLSKEGQVAGSFLSSGKGAAKMASLVQQAVANLSALFTIFRQLGPVLGGTIGLLSKLGNWFSSLPQPIQGLLSKIAAVSLVSGLLISRFSGVVVVGAKLVGAIASIGPALVKIGVQFVIAAAKGLLFGLRVLWIGIQVVAQFALMAAKAIVWAATMAAQWLIAMGPIGWIAIAVVAIVALVVLNWNRIKSFTLRIWSDVVSWLHKTWSSLSNTVHSVWDKILGFIKAWWPLLLGVVTGGLGILIGLVVKYHSQILGAIRRAWDSAWQKVSSAISKIISIVKTLPGRVLSGLGNLGHLLIGAGQALVQGLWNGISGAGGWLMGKVRGFASNILSNITSFFGIGSPSKLMASAVGRWLPPGIAVGIDSTASVASAAMTRMGRRVSAAAGISVGSRPAGHFAFKAPSSSGSRAPASASGTSGIEEAVRQGAYDGVSQGIQSAQQQQSSSASPVSKASADAIAADLRSLATLGIA